MNDQLLQLDSENLVQGAIYVKDGRRKGRVRSRGWSVLLRAVARAKAPGVAQPPHSGLSPLPCCLIHPRVDVH